jgi:penicillin G amidase
VAHRVSGVTLPGTPAMVVGSNGRVAWGFTNSYIDTVDLVVVETDGIADIRYRVPGGWRDIEERTETITVKGAESVTMTVQSTQWGPIVSPEAIDGRHLALRWNAHDPAATNLAFMRLEKARSTEEALELARRVGMPNNNILIGDAEGNIAWTVTGVVPRRMGYDGRLPVSWSYGDRGWMGYWSPEEVPALVNPDEGVLWTANNRIVGGDAYAKLGDGGYDSGFRAGAIRDDLRALVADNRKVTSKDALDVALDDRGRYLQRWQKLLMQVLDDSATAGNERRREMRELVQSWNGRASADSAGYRLLQGFRQKAGERALAPFLERPRNRYERFSFGRFKIEDAVWRLITEKPARLLNPDHASWDALLVAAADDVIADARNEKVSLSQFTWGRRNTLRMQHPFSRFLPAPVARFISMPAEPLPGDSNMARVQGRSFGASQRLVVAPGHEHEAIFHMPGGQSGHPLSPFFRAGHDAWVKGEPTPLLPGAPAHTLTLTAQ